MYSAVNLYSDDVVVDVITICGNQNFHLRLLVKSRSLVIKIVQIQNQSSKSYQQRSKPTLNERQHKDDIYHIIVEFTRSMLAKWDLTP
jgi:hypothetical protein